MVTTIREHIHCSANRIIRRRLVVLCAQLSAKVNREGSVDPRQPLQETNLNRACTLDRYLHIREPRKLLKSVAVLNKGNLGRYVNESCRVDRIGTSRCWIVGCMGAV